ncbi:M85 family metallopeptidase [Paraburkholderia sp. DGU8]|uniref:M85 family metallopeptidase n=1 Tax=Paraburkholderia sp. DGU8 TaxID=3161997 RepID=UPI003466F50A
MEIFDKALNTDASPASTVDLSNSHRVKRNIPRNDDEYANHVLRVGAQTPLGPTEIDELRQDVIRSVISSRSRLIDQHTADMIGNTVLDALTRSQTFRTAVGYGMQNNAERLSHITYRNQYESNPESSAESRDIGELSIDDLYEHDARSAPIIPASEAAEDREGRPHVSFGVAPNADSPYMPSWQEGLIHEIIHHVTAAGDPSDNTDKRLGPTEILARRVAQEMGWPIPNFTGYAEPARNAHLNERNLGALREAAQRHEAHESAFFERLDTIADGGEASPDFHELGASSVASPPQYQMHQNQSDHFSGVSNSAPPPDLHEIQLDHRPPYFFTFASSSPSGAPTGFQSASAARSASWATQGRFFQYGKPVDGNPHARAFTFPDGSKVLVRAHEPLLADSDGLKFGRFLTVPAATLAGAGTGFAVGAGVGAVGGAVGGLAGGIKLAASYPYDRIWQGFTLDYYEKGSAKPLATQYMYAWDSDATRVRNLSQIRDSKEWPDYADFGPDANWSWLSWKSDNAPLRMV